MNWNWINYKKEKPKENKDYLCVCLMPDFGGGGYTIGQTVFRYYPDREGFDCDNGFAVLFWSECPEYPKMNFNFLYE